MKITIYDFLANSAFLFPAMRLYHAICKTQPTTPSVGVCLEGDTNLRLKGTVALYRSGRINRIIVSGGVDDPQTNNIPAASMKEYLISKGLPAYAIEIDDKSINTHDHPKYVNPIVNRAGLTNVIVITSGYHLLRAYLRFLNELISQEYPYNLYAQPVGTIESWFKTSPTEGKYRIRNFYCDELKKIRTYRDLATFDEAWKYIYSLNNKI